MHFVNFTVERRKYLKNHGLGLVDNFEYHLTNHSEDVLLAFVQFVKIFEDRDRKNASDLEEAQIIHC